MSARGRGGFRGSGVRDNGRGARFHVPRSRDSANTNLSPDYNDPEADMVIQTSDAVEFRVHSYFLTAASTFFRHMPEPAVDDWGCGDATIHLEAQSETLKTLLDIITKTDWPIKNIEYTWEEISSAIDLGERYGFDTLPRLVSPIMHNYSKDYCWDVFRFATKNNFDLLAAHAIPAFANDETWLEVDHCNMHLELFNDIPQRYVVPFIRNMALYPNEGSQGKVDWKAVAYNFPAVREMPFQKPARQVSHDWSAESCYGRGGW